MTAYSKPIQVRWSDLDPNFHVRHSVYYDWGAFARISLMTDCGLTPAAMLQHQIGPILFREECVFRKEIRYNDEIVINVQLLKSTPDAGRWTMVHEIWRGADTLCAIVTVDGAWIDTGLRKLAALPESFRQAFENIPRAVNFEWTQKK
jgi:acyl-CoA thioester hydrolase